MAHANLSWRGRYSSLEEFYNEEYPSVYYSMSPDELEIDVEETLEDFERYSIERQQEEFLKCGQSFSYFCHKFLRIIHPTRGPVPFIIYSFQRECTECFSNYKYNIVRKFRQGGLTTVAVLYHLWRSMFRFEETTMLLSRSERESIAAGEISRRAIEYMPTWLRPDMSTINKHEQSFALTGSKMFFYTPNAARGRSLTTLIIDEAAFIPNMDDHWKSMFPTLSTGGNCIVISTVKGVGNWYAHTYKSAEAGENPFHIIDIHYTSHPLYNNEDWVKKQKSILKEKGWRQEVLGDFLASGSTYIPFDVINDYEMMAKSTEVLKKRFPEYNNGGGKEYIEDWESMGALWIFKDREVGKEYIIGVDGAEGVGEEGDNSCFQVIDANTCEQCAEFYSNCCPTDKFAKILEQMAIYYNNALVVVENMGGAGMAILMKLKDEFYYENLYYEDSKSFEKAGVRVGRQNRPLILEALQNRMLNKAIIIHSTRFINELRTFIWNKSTQRAEASKDAHDDSIMAMAHAIYVRDKNYRQVQMPLMVAEGKEIATVESCKVDIYEQIKREINKDVPEDWMDPVDRKIIVDHEWEEDLREFLSRYRPHNDLLREFGM